MKRLFTICSLAFLSLAACDKEGDASRKTHVATAIDGNWRQVIAAFSDGSKLKEHPVLPADAEVKSFTNGHYSTNDALSEYDRYSADSATVTLENSNNGDQMTFAYTIKDDTLTMRPTTPVCVEGCYARYVRNTSEK